MVMRMTLVHALIACALGVALGLLWDAGQARSANVDRRTEGYSYNATGSGAVFRVCVDSGTPSAICAMKYVMEDHALEVAADVLVACPSDTQQPDCLKVRAYIKQRWGY